MRKILTIIIFFLNLYFSGLSQEKVIIPKRVLSSFKKTAHNIQGNWEIKDTCYLVSFSQDGLDKKGVYSKNGNLILTASEISTSQLHPKAIDYILFQNDFIKKVFIIITYKKEIFYNVFSNSQHLFFTKDGDVIEQSKLTFCY